MRFSNVKLFHQLFEANPIVALSLATLIQVSAQRPDCIEVERIETGKVAIYTEVITPHLSRK